jgi:hypothetical protein
LLLDPKQKERGIIKPSLPSHETLPGPAAGDQPGRIAMLPEVVYSPGLITPNQNKILTLCKEVKASMKELI